MLHLHGKAERRTANGFLITYDVDCFQSAYDEITIVLKDSLLEKSTFFDIPIKKKSEFCIDIHKTFVGNQNGSAADLIKFIDEMPGGGWLRKIVETCIFENKKNFKILTGN